jgi:plasmid replication initiation protein
MKNNNEVTLEKVRKSNALINGQYKNTLHEQRVLLTILSKIGFDDNMSKAYRVKWSEIIEATKGHAGTSKKIEAVCESLSNKRIRIEKGESIRGFGFVAEYDIRQDEQYVDFHLSPGMRDQLLDLLSRGHFTIYNLQCVLSLPSTHSVRLYEILRSRSFMKQPVNIPLDDLKWSLNIPIDETGGYNNFSDFRRFILEKAQKDFARNTDIKFTFKPVKTSRRVTSVLFTITENKKWQPSIISAIAKQQEPVRDFIRTGDIVLIGGERVEVGLSVAEHNGKSIPIGQLTTMLKAGKIKFASEEKVNPEEIVADLAGKS